MNNPLDLIHGRLFEPATRHLIRAMPPEARVALATRALEMAWVARPRARAASCLVLAALAGAAPDQVAQVASHLGWEDLVQVAQVARADQARARGRTRAAAWIAARAVDPARARDLEKGLRGLGQEGLARALRQARSTGLPAWCLVDRGLRALLHEVSGAVGLWLGWPPEKVAVYLLEGASPAKVGSPPPTTAGPGGRRWSFGGGGIPSPLARALGEVMGGA